MVVTKGMQRWQVLSALYNKSIPLGMGMLQFNAEDLSREEAMELTIVNDEAPRCYFDYLKGRIMKVDLTNEDEFDPRLYDRDNGEGAAEAAVNFWLAAQVVAEKELG